MMREEHRSDRRKRKRRWSEIDCFKSVDHPKEKRARHKGHITSLSERTCTAVTSSRREYRDNVLGNTARPKRRGAARLALRSDLPRIQLEQLRQMEREDEQRRTHIKYARQSKPIDEVSWSPLDVIDNRTIVLECTTEEESDVVDDHSRYTRIGIAKIVFGQALERLLYARSPLALPGKVETYCLASPIPIAPRKEDLPVLEFGQQPGTCNHPDEHVSGDVSWLDCSENGSDIGDRDDDDDDIDMCGIAMAEDTANGVGGDGDESCADSEASYDAYATLDALAERMVASSRPTLLCNLGIPDIHESDDDTTVRDGTSANPIIFSDSDDEESDVVEVGNDIPRCRTPPIQSRLEQATDQFQALQERLRFLQELLEENMDECSKGQTHCPSNDVVDLTTRSASPITCSRESSLDPALSPECAAESATQEPRREGSANAGMLEGHACSQPSSFSMVSLIEVVDGVSASGLYRLASDDSDAERNDSESRIDDITDVRGCTPEPVSKATVVGYDKCEEEQGKTPVSAILEQLQDLQMEIEQRHGCVSVHRRASQVHRDEGKPLELPPPTPGCLDMWARQIDELDKRKAAEPARPRTAAVAPSLQIQTAQERVAAAVQGTVLGARSQTEDDERPVRIRSFTHFMRRRPPTNA